MGVIDGLAGSAGGALIGMAMQGANDKRQIKQQEKLQRMQIEGQKEMGNFNREQQMRLWQDTNYSEQRQQMEKAGLNVGMMYGMSGGGGATTAANAGNVSGGSAPVGGGEIGMGMQTGMAAAMNEAQIENIRANTEKTKVDTAKTAGADTENVIADTGVKTQSIENLKQSVQSDKAKQALTEIQTQTEAIRAEVANATIDDAITDIKWGARQTIGLANQAEAKGWVDKATVDTAIKSIQADYSGILLDNMLKQAGLQEIKAKIENLKEQIRIGDTKNAIDAFRAEIQAEYPSIMQTSGKIINDGLKILEGIGILHDRGEKIEK